MNLYVLVEGELTEPALYEAWFAHVFPGMTRVPAIDDIQSNTFYFFSGGGWPQMLDYIHASLLDIEDSGRVDHFLIVADTEFESVADRAREIQDRVAVGPAFDNTHIILQHRCVETWLLGHRGLMARPPVPGLAPYLGYYDVADKDPELLAHPHGRPRAVSRYHKQYLCAAFTAAGHRYSKRDPCIAKDMAYLRALVARTEGTPHLSSFADFVATCRRLGSQTL